MTFHHYWESADLGVVPRGVGGADMADPGRDQDRPGSCPQRSPLTGVDVVEVFVVVALIALVLVAVAAIVARTWA